jgi:hypothetical protein
MENDTHVVPMRLERFFIINIFIVTWIDSTQDYISSFLRCSSSVIFSFYKKRPINQQYRAYIFAFLYKMIIGWIWQHVRFHPSF